MKLDRLTIIRPNMGAYRSLDSMVPLAVGILAARTPEDIEVTFYDERVEAVPDNDFPDLVALTVETFTARRAYAIAERYRKAGIPVVMGGYHPTFLPYEALLHADAVILGDAEGAWERLLDDFRQRKLQRIYAGGNERLLDDTITDRKIFRGRKYASIEPVQYSRGCRFHCEFCSINAFYHSVVRHRSIESMATEFEQLDLSKLVFFADDNLFGSLSELERLLDFLKPLNIRWCCQISLDVAKHSRLIDRLAGSGCVLVTIGFESLSPTNLAAMNKAWNLGSGLYHEVVRQFHDRGIAVYGTFVFGYDEDRVDSIYRTLDFAMKARLEIANFNMLTPTPGTAIYRRLEQERRLLIPEWWWHPDYRYGDPIFMPKQMSPEELSASCYDAKKKFYSWGSIFNRLIASPGSFDLFRAGMIAMANVISRKEIMHKQRRLLG